jgi:hypothetical protein
VLLLELLDRRGLLSPLLSATARTASKALPEYTYYAEQFGVWVTAQTGLEPFDLPPEPDRLGFLTTSFRRSPPRSKTTRPRARKSAARKKMR